MNQGQLFGISNLDGVGYYSPAKPLARSTDPVTSKAGAREVQPRLQKLERQALDAIGRWPLCTALELEQKVGLIARTIGRRLHRLERLGLIVRWSRRRCRVTGRLASTWKLADGQAQNKEAAAP